MHIPCPVRFLTSQRNSPHSCFHLTGELFCKWKNRFSKASYRIWLNPEPAWKICSSGASLKIAFCQMYITLCGRFGPYERGLAGCAHTGQICIKPACVSGPKTSVNILQVLRIQLFACIGRTSAEHCILRHLVYGTEIALPVNPIFLQCRYLQYMA